MRAKLPLAALLLAGCFSPLAGCFSPFDRPTAPYPDERSETRVHSAALLDDGRTLLISWSEGVFRAVPDNAAWSDTRRQHSSDVKVLALVDPESATARVLRRLVREPASDGNGNYTIEDVGEGRALLWRGRSTSKGTLIYAGGLAVLDLATGDLETLDADADPAPLRLGGVDPPPDVRVRAAGEGLVLERRVDGDWQQAPLTVL
ncbi:MAG: hypothetical protein AAF682_30730 [Planctomycetota bacterium]